MHRQVLVLAGAQALFQIVPVMVITIGGLAGGMIASSPRWATLPRWMVSVNGAAYLKLEPGKSKARRPRAASRHSW